MCLFPLASLIIFSLSQVFSDLIMMCLGGFLKKKKQKLILLGVCWASWICKFIDFYQIWKFPAIIFSFMFHVQPSFFSPSEISITYMLDYCSLTGHWCPVQLFLVFLFLCMILGSFCRYSASSLIFSSALSNTLLISSSIFYIEILYSPFLEVTL